MAMQLDFLSTYTLMAIEEQSVPKTTFFRDRYFPTGEGDIFSSDKVLTEYRKGDRKMASFVSPRVGDIPMDRRGYEVREYEPARIAPSRLLTVDQLSQKGFGEALYPGMTPAQRAARLLQNDLEDIEDRITRREEWMCSRTMIENGCTMQEYIDNQTKGDTLIVKYYDGTSEHVYTPAAKWNAADGDMMGDVVAMCRKLSSRGLRAMDLIIGSDVASWMQSDEKWAARLDKNSGILIGQIDQKLTEYEGVSVLGILNFGGFRLNVICVDETYEDDDGKDTKYFPATSALVTAPDCGHIMYGQITQINYGETEHTTFAGRRIPKVFVDQGNDTRKIRIACRPLAAPKNYTPYIYAADVVG